MKILQIFIVSVILSAAAFGQSVAQIERELTAALKEVQKYSNYGGNYDDEKLLAANAAFDKLILKHTKSKATLDHSFPTLGKLMFIATAPDRRFRIYSWDSETGGTMHDYSRVYQFIGDDGKVYSKMDDNVEIDGGPGSFVYDVFSVATRSGPVYIVCSTFIGSTQDHSQAARLYRIDGNHLKDDVRLIKTASGLTATLGFEYNFFSVVERKQRPVKLITFDRRTNTLRIPVVIADKEFPNGRVTNRFISYRFDGTYFVKVS